MYKVTYRLYRRYNKERTFNTVEEARKFFYGYCVRSANVSRAELKTI